VTTPLGTTTGTPSLPGVTGTTGATGTTSSADSALGPDAFMKLLVAQLKYQNPLQPADGAQYMAQMAQFTQVEKLADLQQSQTSLLSWQRTVAGQGMIGKDITATLAATGEKITGHVTGLRLTDAGPRLVLSNGSTVSVDEVTDVDEGTGTASAAPPTTSPAATGSSGATSASTPTTSGSTTGSATGGTTGSATGSTTTSTTGKTTGTGSTSTSA
jgi:flagellar basal-body rod modification protein FlgD